MNQPEDHLNYEKKYVFQNDAAARYVFFALSNDRSGFDGFDLKMVKTVTHYDKYYDTAAMKLNGAGEAHRVRCVTQGHSEQYERTIKTREQHGATYRYLKQKKGVEKADFDNYTPDKSDDGQPLEYIATIRCFRSIFSVNSPEEEEIARMHLDQFMAEKTESRDRLRFYEIELVFSHLHRKAAETFAHLLQNAFNLIAIRRAKIERALGLTPFETVFSHKGLKAGKRTPLIIDTNPGVDGLLALLLAYIQHPAALKAVTIVGGNINPLRGANNALHALNVARDHFDTSAPLPEIGVGQEPPRDIPANAQIVHGRHGMGDVQAKESSLRKDFPDAAACVRKILTEAEEKVTLVCTGPLTNLAAWTQDPNLSELLRSKVAMVVSMGGVFFNCGNKSQTAEFNLYLDPQAGARVVSFFRGEDNPVKLVFAGLDVTHQVKLLPKHLETLADGSFKAFLTDLTRPYMAFHKQKYGFNGCHLHAPLAVGYALDPTLCEIESFHVEVETRGLWTSGMTVGDYRPTRMLEKKSEAGTWVCFKTDARRFEETFLKHISAM